MGHTLDLILSDKWLVDWQPEEASVAGAVTPVMCDEVGDDTISSEASSSSLSSDAPEEVDEAAPAESEESAAVLRVKVKVGFEIAYQVASFTRHVFNVEDPTHLVCGRTFSDNFVKGDLDVLPFCALCLRRGKKIGCLTAEDEKDFDGFLVAIPK